MNNCVTLASCSAAAVAFAAFSAPAQDRHWISPIDGSWSVPSNWNPADVPDTAAENAVFDLLGSYTAQLTGSTNIGFLSLLSGAGALQVAAGGTLGITNGIFNHSTITINPTGAAANTYLKALASLNITGSGRIVLNAMPSNLNTASLTWNAGSEVVTNGPGHTIDGTGAISVDFVNNGTVAADVGGKTLLLQIRPKVNNALLSATGGGTLNIQTSVTQGPSGEILAAGGTVELYTATISGGSLRSLGSGTASVTSSSTLSSVTNNAQMYVQAGNTLALTGPSTTNNAQVVLNPGGSASNTYLRIDSNPLTLTGTGEVVLNAHPSNLGTANIVWHGGSEVLTNASGHTIRGTGAIQVQLVNEGEIRADVTDRYLQIYDGPKTNNNLMTATNGGILYLLSAMTQGANGRILAQSGLVDFHAANVTGGRLDADGVGYAQVSANSTMASFTNNAPLSVQPGVLLAVVGPTFTNNGQVVVNPIGAASNTWLRADSTSITLAGTGDIVLNAHPSNLNTAAMVWLGGSETFVNSPTHTIRGTGYIPVQLVNEGTVLADQPERTLLFAQGDKTNNALVKATNGGILDIRNSFTQGSLGRIVSDGSLVVFQGATVTGGRLDAAGTGFAQIVASSDFSGLTNNALVQVLPGTVLGVVGPTFANNGQIVVNPNAAASNTYFRANSGAVTLEGTGEIVLNAHPSNLNTAAMVWLGGSEVVTNSASHTIRGTGYIPVQLVNNGSIRADQTDRTLLLAQTPKTNNATISAINGGILNVQTAVDQSASARLLADDGSIVLQTATISGGRLEAQNSGTVTVVGNSMLSGIINAAPMAVSPGVALSLAGPTFQNNGTITVNPNAAASNTQFRLASDLTLAGDGQLILNANPSNLNTGAVVGASGAESLTNGATHTIAGNGYIATALVNAGRLAPGSAITPGLLQGSNQSITNTASGVMTFDLFGVASTNDRITSSGPISLAGTLEVHLAPGFGKGSGAFVTIIQGASVSGTFTTLMLPHRMRAFYTPTQVRLLDPCEADLDDGSEQGVADGAVTIDDLIFFLRAFEAGSLPADLDNGSMTGTHDDAVTIDDLLYFLIHFENGC